MLDKEKRKEYCLKAFDEGCQQRPLSKEAHSWFTTWIDDWLESKDLKDAQGRQVMKVWNETKGSETWAQTFAQNFRSIGKRCALKSAGAEVGEISEGELKAAVHDQTANSSCGLCPREP
jgi:hypothetical protein